MNQPVTVHGIACRLVGAPGDYRITTDGRQVAAAPTRFLACARAATAVLANPIPTRSLKGAPDVR